MKLVVPEPETTALWRVVTDCRDRASSDLARVEVRRAVRRLGLPGDVRTRAERVLGRIALIRVDDEILERAAELGPPELRSLDALHLATAIGLGGELRGFVTYDARLARAAGSAGLPVSSPA